MENVLAAVQVSDGLRAREACEDHVKTAASVVLLQLGETADVT